ncbi:MAG: hypothetical protein BWK80_32640 [Desulfobacteraceae bacterium IS3]|nr:MAG: hypothetical protein BWK80_32640 [Desulfobacteraceae bacterium IS3]
MIEKLPILKRGNNGFFVERLQTRLEYWKLLSIEDVDGDFGPVTERKVKEFQRLRPLDKCQYSPHGLNETGIVDKNTWCELLCLKPEDIEIVEIVVFVSKVQADSIFGNPIHYDKLEDLNRCLQRFNITTPLRIRHFMAQIAHESGGLRWFKELSSGWKYEGRPDLGNVNPGDGPKFKGAGAIQLTGRYNYQRFSEVMNDPRIMEGVDYVAHIYPFVSSGFWWYDNKMNQFVDSGASCREVSARVNGKDPANGLADRLSYYSKACMIIS